MDVHQLLGQLFVDYQNLREEYRKLLRLVARIKAGEVDPRSVVILPGDCWEIVPIVDDPAPPAEAQQEIQGPAN